MDINKSFTLRYCIFDMDEPSAAVKTQADYKQVLKYLDSVRRILGEECRFLRGYEAGCLANRTYSPVHIPTEQDNEVKEYIRVRSGHKNALKKVKQQILSFCLRHGYRYTDTKKTWTQALVKCLQNLPTEGVYKEVLAEYMGTFTYLTDKIEWLDQRIEEYAQKRISGAGEEALMLHRNQNTDRTANTCRSRGERFQPRRKFCLLSRADAGRGLQRSP